MLILKPKEWQIKKMIANTSSQKKLHSDNYLTYLSKISLIGATDQMSCAHDWQIYANRTLLLPINLIASKDLLKTVRGHVGEVVNKREKWGEKRSKKRQNCTLASVSEDSGGPLSFQLRDETL